MTRPWEGVREAFIDATAVEIDLMGRALPLIPISATHSARIRLDGSRVDVKACSTPPFIANPWNAKSADKVASPGQGCCHGHGLPDSRFRLGYP